MKKILLYIMFVFLLTACQTKKGVISTDIALDQESLTPDQGECLPPLANFPYPTGDAAIAPVPVKKLPSGNWKAITTIPDLPSPQAFGEDAANLEALQNVDGKDRIWIIVEGSEKYHLTYYQIDAGDWKNVEVEYVAEYSDHDLFFPRLFLGQNNSIWVAQNPSNAYGISADTTLLSIYDEASQQFKRVFALKDVPTFDPKKSIVDVTITNLQMDGKGDLWFFLSIHEWNKETEYQLFKFSLSSHSIERHLTDLELDARNGTSLVITSDNTLYLLSTQNANLVRYNPASEDVKEIAVPSDVKSSGDGSLSSETTPFLDSHQRLWINDKGWLDLASGDHWHVIIKSPIFIMYQPGSGVWRQTMPVYSIDTDDGRLWYSASYRGTGWLDSSNGKWCLFTSYPSKVVKASDGYLWMIASGKLYKSLFQ